MRMKELWDKRQKALSSGRDSTGRCAAIQYSDQMVCAKCNLAWDVNDAEPPACKESRHGA